MLLWLLNRWVDYIGYLVLGDTWRWWTHGLARICRRSPKNFWICRVCLSLSILFSSLLFFKFHSLSLSHCVCDNLVSSCRGSQPIITSTTVEVVVPRALVAEIYGENGECLKQILQVRPLHLTIDDVNCLVSICLLFGWFLCKQLNSCLSDSYMIHGDLHRYYFT